MNTTMKKALAATITIAAIAGIGIASAAPANASTKPNVSLVALEDGPAGARGGDNQDFTLTIKGYDGPTTVTVLYKRYNVAGDPFQGTNTAFADTFKARNGKYRITIPLSYGDNGEYGCTTAIVKVTDANGKNKFAVTSGSHYDLGTEKLLDSVVVKKM